MGSFTAVFRMTSSRAAESAKSYIDKYKLSAHVIVHAGTVEEEESLDLAQRVDRIVAPLVSLVTECPQALTVTWIALPAATHSYKLFNEAVARAIADSGNKIEYVDPFKNETISAENFRIEKGKPKYTPMSRDTAVRKIILHAALQINITKDALKEYEKKLQSIQLKEHSARTVGAQTEPIRGRSPPPSSLDSSKAKCSNCKWQGPPDNKNKKRKSESKPRHNSYNRDCDESRPHQRQRRQSPSSTRHTRHERNPR